MKQVVRLLSLLFLRVCGPLEAQRWTEVKANQWYAGQPWLVGSNYSPATAINQLEMWQAATFDPARIDLELGWAENIGMNTMRVFLHDLLWQQDPDGFRKRIDTFLSIAQKHGIRPMFVLFDSCWDPLPKTGPQRAPKPGVHNSGWVQSPGAKALQDPSQLARLEAYVKGVVGAFAGDDRILAWDIWNEPDNTNTSSYAREEPKNKMELVMAVLPKAWAWARAAHPRQPLTAGLWHGDWSAPATMTAMDRLIIDLSDVVSFHNYEEAPKFARQVELLKRYKRPILCTEYMARGVGSTFQGTLPIAKANKVAAINWGLVAGKTQTYLPWDSWEKPYINGREPAVWFHEVFRTDGKPYRPEEVDFIRAIIGKKAKAAGAGK